MTVDTSSSTELAQVLRTGRGRLARCRLCGGMHFQFGNFAACLDAESFLRLSNLIHRMATDQAAEREAEERVSIPMAQGHICMLLDRDEIAELYSLIRAGLKWLSEESEKAPTCTVH